MAASPLRDFAAGQQRQAPSLLKGDETAVALGLVVEEEKRREQASATAKEAVFAVVLQMA